MFPDKPGGVAVYVHEAWKDRFAPLGALASFGYWCGWALVLALLGITMGSLIQAQWFPDATATFFTGLADLGLPALLGAAALVLAVLTAFNAAILVVGATSPDLTADGGLKEALIGVALLLLGVVFYVVRTRQDRKMPPVRPDGTWSRAEECPILGRCDESP